MKTTIVPAQVTTVEDKIAGSLSFTQLLLMTFPVFLNAALFAFLPPFFNISGLKLVIGGLILLTCLILAIRVRDKLILTWIVVVGRYNLRPRHHLYDKNDPYIRTPISIPDDDFDEEEIIPVVTDKEQAPMMPTLERVRLQSAISDPRAQFHIRREKGGLRVYIREIKKEGF